MLFNYLCKHTKRKLTEFPKLLMHVDGGCQPKNPGGVATAAWVLYDGNDPKTLLVEEGRVVADGGPNATNNYGEYASLVFALLYLWEQDWRGNLLVKADSKLLVEQISGRWKVKDEKLKGLRDRVVKLIDDTELHRVTPEDPIPPEGKGTFEIVHVMREFNTYADEVSNRAYQKYNNQKKESKDGAAPTTPKD